MARMVTFAKIPASQVEEALLNIIVSRFDDCHYFPPVQSWPRHSSPCRFEGICYTYLDQILSIRKTIAKLRTVIRYPTATHKTSRGRSASRTTILPREPLPKSDHHQLRELIPCLHVHQQYKILNMRGLCLPSVRSELPHTLRIHMHLYAKRGHSQFGKAAIFFSPVKISNK